MNENIQKWIDALRSDLYDQNFNGSDQPLRTDDNKFSAIGVLCNVHALEFPEIAQTQFHPTEYLECEYFIPKKVREWIGIDGNISFDFKRYFSFEGRVYRSVDEMSRAMIPFYIIADAIELQFYSED